MKTTMPILFMKRGIHYSTTPRPHGLGKICQISPNFKQISTSKCMVMMLMKLFTIVVKFIAPGSRIQTLRCQCCNKVKRYSNCKSMAPGTGVQVLEWDQNGHIVKCISYQKIFSRRINWMRNYDVYEALSLWNVWFPSNGF